jgi:tRNA(Arg) A34 adenosine deaminase TadA
MQFSESFINRVALDLKKRLAEADGRKPYAAALYFVSKKEAIKSNGRLICGAYNTEYQSNNKIAHAEMNVLNMGAKDLFEAGHHPDDLSCLFVNTRPCPMCTAAIVEAEIFNVYFFWDNGYKKAVAETIIGAKQASQPFVLDVVPSKWSPEFEAQSKPRA